MSFLQNAWYLFALSEEVIADAFVFRTIAEHEVLVYRLQDGSLAAIQDRCPHRFVPLHMGKQVGDAIQCGYHGLEFGADGRCVKHPVAGAAIPSRACVRSYPVVEQHTLIWLWLGNPEQADEDQIPDYAFLTDPARRSVGGYLHSQANYQLAIDNLLDLTHVQFVHASQQASDAYERLQFTVDNTDSSVTTRLTFPDGHPGPVYQSMLDPGIRLDMVFELRWNLPSCCKLTVRGHAPGTPEQELFATTSAHIVSPETATTCHYFYINSRSYEIDNPAIDAGLRAWQEQGFHQEDKPMLEAQQKYLGERDLMSLEPAGLNTDAGAVRARRILAARIAAEQNTA